MEPESIHAPGEGEPKHSTQIISLFVGGLLFILGLSGILFEGFAGLHLSPAYSTIIAISGGTLFYTGYKNKSRDAFLSCLAFSIFYGLHALAGWTLGVPGTPRLGFEQQDTAWLSIIPNFHELGRNDHILNTALSVVLMGGAIDWFRRNSEKGKRGSLFKEIKDDFKTRHSHGNTPVRQ